MYTNNKKSGIVSTAVYKVPFIYQIFNENQIHAEKENHLHELDE